MKSLPQNLFPLTEEVCAIDSPVNWTSAKTEKFFASCREIGTFHYENNSVIKHLYDRYQFHPSAIVDEASLLAIPALGVTAMKYHLLTTLATDTAVLKLTSSGTRGQKTQVWFDQGSLDRVQRMMDVYFEQEDFVSDIPNNYFIFNYDPDDAGDLGIAYTEKNQMRFAPIADHHFAIKKDKDGNWGFDKELAAKILRRFESEQKPLRIFAMPAFLFEFVNWMRANKIVPFRFPETSWIMTGGGWKAAEDKKISRAEFRIMCFENFGIPLAKQRDAYGMAEHCAPYFECREHRLHVPVYNRVLIRNPIDMAPVPNGDSGLMELVTPFNAMMPTLAIQTTDYGRIHAEPCPCGFKSPTFEILGRAGLSKHKGCAITADEIVRRK